ncbi:MAG: dimethyl sulfoxide reductase anchor subunit [Betaproteobacteria bacterium]|nr:dimethyl sulfoxide reductase anchor subunit [Betaproteobacteria bacterium]
MSFGPRPWQQAHWDWRAATNFICGGTGSGLIMVLAAAWLDSSEARALLLAGAALVGIGLTGVWLEIGRPLRALHVYFNPRTSWMSREALASLPLFGFVLLAAATGAHAWTLCAALSALAFLYCHGRILHAAKGIPAWREPWVTPLILITGLAEGAGLLLAASAGFSAVAAPTLTVFAGLALARILVWRGYRARLSRHCDRRALAPLDAAGGTLWWTGTVLPLAALIFAQFAPAAAAPLAALGGLAALGAGWSLKYALVTRAAFNQGFSLPVLPVRGAR